MKELTSLNVKDELSNSKNPVLVDFWAAWCGPCKAMMPILERLEKEREDIQVAKIDVEAYPELAKEYGVSSIPTFILFREGKETARITGAASFDSMRNLK